METGNQTFEQRKKAALSAAMAEGIVDVVLAESADDVSIETVELATELMKKHGPAIYKKLAECRKQPE